MNNPTNLRDVQRNEQSLFLCVYMQSGLCSLTTWLSGPERNWDKVFSGHLASGTMPSQPQSEQTWRQTYIHTHTHTLSLKKPPQHAHIQIPHHRIPSNVHSHMHKPAHKHTHYATHSQTISVCVWNESRVVRKTACLKKRKKKEPCPASGTNTTQSRDSVATVFWLSILLFPVFF